MDGSYRKILVSDILLGRTKGHTVRTELSHGEILKILIEEQDRKSHEVFLFKFFGVSQS